MPDVSTPGQDPSKTGKKLPAPEFCNKKNAGKQNPIYGKGALGNQFQSRMFYSGLESDKEEWVRLVQTMLSDPALGYDIGPKGVDGKFGDDTEKAVKKFQKEHEDWHEDALKVDGLVGPETADALNRAMVGVEGWYEVHPTETILTINFALLTVTSEELKKPVSFYVKNTEKGKVVVRGQVPKRPPPKVAGVWLSSRFSYRKSFPKPSMIPVLQEISQRAGSDQSTKVLIMGHTDPIGDDATNYKLSLARAKAVACLLVGDKKYFRKRFDTADVLEKWSWEEVQWMLNAIEVEGEPLYAGLIDGHYATMTRRGLAHFQISKGLEINYLCDETTLLALIDEYISLIGEVRPQMTQIELVGGGSWHQPRSFGKQDEIVSDTELPKEQRNLVDEQVRRVEIFLSERPFSPPPAACPKSRHANCHAYHVWSDSVTETLEKPKEYTMPIQLLDDDDIPISGKTVTVSQYQGDETMGNKVTYSSGVNGTIKCTQPPGLYRIEFEHANQTYVSDVWFDSDDMGGMTVRAISPIVG